MAMRPARIGAAAEREELDMHSTHVSTVFERMVNNRRSGMAQPGVGARGRTGLVTVPGSVPLTVPGRGAAGSTVRARSTTRRRWFSRTRQDELDTPPADIEFTWGNRHPGTPGFARWVAAAGQRVAVHGIEASARVVDNLVDVARTTGVEPVAVGVLADASAPGPARVRAFAVVASALVRLGSATSATQLPKRESTKVAKSNM